MATLTPQQRKLKKGAGARGLGEGSGFRWTLAGVSILNEATGLPTHEKVLWWHKAEQQVLAVGRAGPGSSPMAHEPLTLN